MVDKVPEVATDRPHRPGLQGGLVRREVAIAERLRSPATGAEAALPSPRRNSTMSAGGSTSPCLILMSRYWTCSDLDLASASETLPTPKVFR